MLKYLVKIAVLLAGSTIALPSIPHAKGMLHTPPGNLKSLQAPNITSIIATPHSAFKSHTVGGLVRHSKSKKQDGISIKQNWKCSRNAIFTWGDRDNGGKGITIHNADNDWRGFYVYHNSCK